MNNTWQARLIGNAFWIACLAIPLLGCVLAVYFKDMNWLVLLAPLGVFMEGGLALGLLAWFVVVCVIG